MVRSVLPRLRVRKILCANLRSAELPGGYIPRSEIPALKNVERPPRAKVRAKAMQHVRAKRAKPKRPITRKILKTGKENGVIVPIVYMLEDLPSYTTSTVEPGPRRRVLSIVDYSRHGDSEKHARQDEWRKPLTAEERDVLERAQSDSSYVLVDTGLGGAPTELRQQDFKRIVGVTMWLDDGVINAYCELVSKRNATYFTTASGARRMQSERGTWVDDAQALVQGGRQRTFVMSSFLYSKLAEPDYTYATHAKRWTKSCPVGVLDCEKLLVPVNIANNHWLLVGVDVRHHCLVYMDSTGGERQSSLVLQRVREWLHEEACDKYGEDRASSLRIPEWRSVVNPPYTPRQRDGSSCGMFVLMLADFLELGKRPEFTQADIPLLRKRVAISLHRGALSNNS